jgi:hypothetical protein
MSKHQDLTKLLPESESLVLSRIDGGWIVGWDRCVSPLACRTIADVIEVLCVFLRARNRPVTVVSLDSEFCPAGSRLILTRIVGGFLLTACHAPDDPVQFVRFDSHGVLEIVQRWLGVDEAPLDQD